MAASTGSARRGKYPNAIVSIVEVGIDPVGIAVDPSGERLYVAARYDDALFIVDTRKRNVVGRVDVGRRPHAVCVTPDGEFAYVANCGSNDVAIVHLGERAVVARVPVGRFPIFLAASPQGDSVYVTNRESGDLTVISTSRRSVVTTVPVGPFPWGIAVLPEGDRVCVGRSAGDSILVLRTSDCKAVDSVRVTPGPEGMAVVGADGLVYVACHGGAVDLVDLGQGRRATSVAMDGYPVAAAALAGDQYVFVTTYASGRLHVIDTSDNRVVGRVGGGRGPNYLASSPDGRTVYVCESHANRVWFVEHAGGRRHSDRA